MRGSAVKVMVESGRERGGVPPVRHNELSWRVGTGPGGRWWWEGGGGMSVRRKTEEENDEDGGRRVKGEMGTWKEEMRK